MNILVFNLLVIILLPALNLFEGGGKDCLQKSSGKQFVSVRSTDTFFLYLFNKLRATHARLCFVCPFRMPFCVEKPKNFLINI